MNMEKKVSESIIKRQEDIKKERDKCDEEFVKLMKSDDFENNKERMFELMIKSIALNKEYKQPFRNLFYNC